VKSPNYANRENRPDLFPQRIGDDAVVETCAIMVKNVELWNVVAGNPAKFIKKRELRDE
jgi:acetyltransferase-like isoleucine patch superfamily enzyme